MFRVTEDWITAHPTRIGGYKAAQLRIIGVKWPPKRGWKKEAEGRLISIADKEKFESFGLPKKSSISAFVPLCNCDVLPWEDCEHTEQAANQAMIEMLSGK